MLRSVQDFVMLQENTYDFYTMERQIYLLKEQFNFCNVKVIGKSILGHPLYCINLGRGPRRIHINGSHHANEWLTSYVIMKSIESMCLGIANKEESMVELFGKNLERVSYDFVPMLNPDGVNLCLHGFKSVVDKSRCSLLYEMNEESMNFSRWKANIRGVDLNRNYDAGFNTYKKISEKKYPSYAHYQGVHIESEPESRALAEWTRKRNYHMVLSYHTQGEVIYWTYDDIMVTGAEEYAKMFSAASGYLLGQPDILSSYAGYKDWFIKYYRRPGFTIECGVGENPIASSQAHVILKQTLPILKLAGRT